MKELPPEYETYRVFRYKHGNMALSVRPEEAKGWQTYHDANDDPVVFTVVITLKENIIRAKLPESAAYDMVEKLAQFIEQDSARSVRNSLLLRKRDT